MILILGMNMGNYSKTPIRTSEDDYDDMIWSIKNISFNKIRAIATDFASELTEDERNKLWDKLKHGKELLRTDEELKYYLYAYGKMHKQKMDRALSLFSWKDFENKHIQIVDWGCGQALATVCFFDYLNRKDIKCEIDKIILIEPSLEALKRAITHVYVYDYVSDVTDVVTLNKYINQVNLSVIRSNAELTIHFFSNVLDISSIDLKRLAKNVQKCSDNEAFVICIGPNNNFNKRIDEFFSYFHYHELLYEYEHDRTNEYDFTAKYCIFALNRKKKNVDLYDGMTIYEFYERYNVSDKKFVFKKIKMEDGELIDVVGFANGRTLKNGNIDYTFFLLSQSLKERGETLNIAFLRANEKDIVLYEPEVGMKYGLITICRVDDFEEL